jgi:hypothetical protein
VAVLYKTDTVTDLSDIGMAVSNSGQNRHVYPPFLSQVSLKNACASFIIYFYPYVRI